jgi:hypothetical protein
MSGDNNYAGYSGGPQARNTPNIVEVDDRLWTYVYVKQGYYKGKYYHMKKTDNALTWNTAAFFFPLEWFAYRKMYLEAFLLWLFNAVMAFAGVWGMKYAMKLSLAGLDVDPNEAWKRLTTGGTEGATWLLEQVQSVDILQSMYSAIVIALGIYAFVMIMARLTICLTANAHYLTRVEKLVASEKNLSKEQIPLQRVNKGGVSVGAVVTVLVATFVAGLFLGI